LSDWAKHYDFKTIVTAYAPVGPVADMLAATKLHLQEQGVELVQIRRPYDSIAWPHAQQGYFKLKARIPELLDSLGIETQEEKFMQQTEAV
jgi:deoxyribodipyrimidine photo-lyase